MDYEPYRVAFLIALRQGSEQRARAVVDHARADGVTLTALYFKVFAPSMVRIGELWEQNELSVAEEHIATAITERLIAILSPSFRSQHSEPSEGHGVIMLGCVAGERHVLGLRMLADLFREQGWRVLDLGADVPAADWVDLARRYNVDVVAIAMTATRHLTTLKSLIRELKASVPGVKILVGGAVFDQNPTLWQTVGADVYNHDPVEASASVSRMHGSAKR